MAINKVEALKRTAVNMAQRARVTYYPVMQRAFQREATRAQVDYEKSTGQTITPLRVRR